MPDVENIKLNEEEIVEEPIVEGGEAQPESEPSLLDVYKQHKLDDRWKAENEQELVDKTLKSYTEMEGHKTRIESENRILRALLDNRDQQFRQQQPQFQQPPPV